MILLKVNFSPSLFFNLDYPVCTLIVPLLKGHTLNDVTSPFVHICFRLTVFPLEQWQIIMLHMVVLIVWNDLVRHSTSSSLSTVQSLCPLPSGATTVGSNWIDTNVWLYYLLQSYVIHRL